jgi:hypothetical protein
MINIDLNNIKKWGDTWLAKFNPNKTEIMIFKLKNLLSPSMSSAVSFMNTKNNSGPRTDPWGTPAFKSSNSDNASLIATF